MQEADSILKNIKETLGSMFEGASEVFTVIPCGGYKRGDMVMKDLDFLITRNDHEPTKYLLLKLIEMLEDKGIFI